MKIQEFEQLSLCQKIYQTQHQGVFLTVIRVNDYIIKLYAIGKFYVEVWYDTHKNEMDVTSFDNLNLLAAYTTDIDLSV